MKKIIAILSLLSISLTTMAAAPKKKTVSACDREYAKIAQADMPTYASIENACNSLVKTTCEAYVNSLENVSGSDADLVLMNCALRTAHSSNLAAGDGQATPACQKAFLHIYTPVTGIAEESAGICVQETAKLCDGKATDLEKSECKAKAARAAYLEASPSSRSKLDATTEQAAQKQAEEDMQEMLNNFGK